MLMSAFVNFTFHVSFELRMKPDTSDCIGVVNIMVVLFRNKKKQTLIPGAVACPLRKRAAPRPLCQAHSFVNFFLALPLIQFVSYW